jgi:hypothetical protein
MMNCVGNHILQEFNTLFLTRFRTYKIATPPLTKTKTCLKQINNCRKVPLQVNFLDDDIWHLQRDDYLEADVVPVSACAPVQVVDDALEAGALARVALVVKHGVQHPSEQLERMDEKMSFYTVVEKPWGTLLIG